MTEPIFCISCDRRLDPLDAGTSQAETSPRNGLVLYSHGGYGSAHFDPMDGGATRLELYLCDDCTVAKAKAIWHVTMGPTLQQNQYRRFR